MTTTDHRELIDWNLKRAAKYSRDAQEAWRSATSGNYAKVLEELSAMHSANVAALSSTPAPVGDDVLDRIESAIALAFEGEGEAWSDRLSGDRLAHSARRAVEGIIERLLASSPAPAVKGDAKLLQNSPAPAPSEDEREAVRVAATEEILTRLGLESTMPEGPRRVSAFVAGAEFGQGFRRPTPPEDVAAGREVFLVTVRKPRNPAHDPHAKVAGVCAWSSACTDSTGEHHTFIARDQFEIDVLTPKVGRVTRIEKVYLPAALAARPLPETEGDR